MRPGRATILSQLSALLFACVGCSSPHPNGAGQSNAPKEVSVPRQKPEWVVGAQPIAAFVAEQLNAHPAAPTIIYVGANWCEPCQRFHNALQAGELDAALAGVRFIAYDLDSARAALDADGYNSHLIPAFVVPLQDGRGGPRRIEGSIKGEGAVAQIMPRLAPLLTASEGRGTHP